MVETIDIPEDFFITSDTWFGRNEILKISNRNFKNIYENIGSNIQEILILH